MVQIQSPPRGRPGMADASRGAAPEPRPIRIVVADDHPVVRQGLAAIIESQPDMTVVAAAADGEEAVRAFREHRPDVALVDLIMPGLDGAEATSAIRREFPDANVVVLTTYAGDEDIYRTLQAGARAYVLKDAPSDELLEVIRSAGAGRRHIAPEIAAKLAERLSGTELTDRERDVLRLMAGGASNEEIGRALFISVGTVKYHVNHILGKLGVEDRTQAVIAAIRRGLVRL
jgi:two-component system, NarL family, response regulator